jgi:hypothetical protein
VKPVRVEPTFRCLPALKDAQFYKWAVVDDNGTILRLCEQAQDALDAAQIINAGRRYK